MQTRTNAVGVTEVRLSENPAEVLVCYSLGSCVGVALWDPVKKMGGMAHVLLPYSDGKMDGKIVLDPRVAAKYGDIGVPYLISLMLVFGCRKERLQAKLAGGAQMLPFLSQGLGDIGEMNQKSVLKALDDWGIEVVGKSLGGKFGRTMRFSVNSGKAVVNSVNQEKLEL